MEYYNNREKVKNLIDKVDDNTKIWINKILFNRYMSKDTVKHSDNLLDYITIGEVKILESKLSKK